MGEPYSPTPGVTLDPYGENRGTLIVLDRIWQPLTAVAPMFTSHGLDAGWMAELWFENGAIVILFANREMGPLGSAQYRVPAAFSVSLHHQFTAPDENGPPFAAMHQGRLLLDPSLDAWPLHENPEPEWLNEWLDRVSRLSAPGQRRAAS